MVDAIPNDKCFVNGIRRKQPHKAPASFIAITHKTTGRTIENIGIQRLANNQSNTGIHIHCMGYIRFFYANILDRRPLSKSEQPRIGLLSHIHVTNTMLIAVKYSSKRIFRISDGYPLILFQSIQTQIFREKVIGIAANTVVGLLRQQSQLLRSGDLIRVFHGAVASSIGFGNRSVPARDLCSAP